MNYFQRLLLLFELCMWNSHFEFYITIRCLRQMNIEYCSSDLFKLKQKTEWHTRKLWFWQIYWYQILSGTKIISYSDRELLLILFFKTPHDYSFFLKDKGYLALAHLLFTIFIQHNANYDLCIIKLRLNRTRRIPIWGKFIKM